MFGIKSTLTGGNLETSRLLIDFVGFVKQLCLKCQMSTREDK